MPRRWLVGLGVLLLVVTGALLARFARASIRAPVFDAVFTCTGRVTALLVNDEATWIGTSGGLARWQRAGSQPVVYTARQGLTGNHVTSIAPVVGRDWGSGMPPAVVVGTDGGAATYFSRPGPQLANAGLPALSGRVGALLTGSSTWAAVGPQVWELQGEAWQPVGGPLPAAITCLEEHDRVLWAGTSRGLFRLSEGQWGRITCRDDPLANSVTCLVSQIPALYVGTVGGLFVYAGGHWSAVTAREGLPDNHVTSFSGLYRHGLCVGTYGGGLAILHDGEVERIAGSPAYITSLGAGFMEEKLWVGTDGQGLYTWDGHAWSRHPFGTGLPDHNITSLATDGRRVFAGTFEGGVTTLDGTEWRGSGTGLGSTWINHVAFGQGRAWARTSGGDLYVRDGDTWHLVTKQSGLTKPWTSCVDSAGDNIWVGTWGAVSKFDGRNWSNFAPKPALAGQVVTAVAVLGRDLWVGTGKGGLVRYHGATGQWETYSLGNGLTDTWITSLAVWRNCVWVGTFSGGLCKYDGRAWEHLGAPAPLPSARVSCLAATDCLYAGTLEGLCRFDGRTWTTYGRGDGLPSEVIQALCVADDRLWVGTPEGLASAKLVAVKEP